MANILIRPRISINIKHIKLCSDMQQRYLGLVYHWLSWPRMSQGAYCELISTDGGIRRVRRGCNIKSDAEKPVKMGQY